MNGQFPPLVPPPGDSFPDAKPWSADQDSARLRLLAALALSTLLHAAALFLPYLGASAEDRRPAQKGRQAAVHFLNATLAFEGDHAFSGPASPAAAPSLADAPAAEHPADTEQRQQNPAEGSDLLPIPAPPYYATDQLTKRPQPLAKVELDPPEIRPIVASGQMILKLWISERGEVVGGDVEKTEMPEAFSKTAVAAFMGLRFAPGERSGQPVRTFMRIEVTYDDSGREMVITPMR